MLDALIRRLRSSAAARGYARRLGPRLRADYGARATYTQQQIEASARRAKLPAGHIRLGYAGFMSDSAFAALHPAGSPDEYHRLRAMLREHAPARSVSAGTEPAPETWGASSVWPDSSHHSGW